MISDERLEQAAAYALGAMEPGEVASFEAELARSPELRREVEELRRVTSYLAMAAPAVDPPARLRERVLEQARASRPITSATSARAGSRPRFALLPWLVAAAAFAGLMVVQGRSSRERATRESLAAQGDSLRLAVAARDSLIATLLAPDVETAKLVATGRPPAARLYWNRTSNQIVLAAFDLPPAPRGRTYQLWGIAGAGATPVSLGTFNTSGTGEGRLTALVPAGTAIAIGAVTEEPEGGSPQPTTQPFLVGELRGNR